MARPMKSGAKQPRISIDVQPQIRRRVRVVAATVEGDLTIGPYVLQGIEDRIPAGYWEMMPRGSEV